MNMTQLKQGSLNGLRRQTNECIDNAYRKGYEDGKKEPREVANVEDTNEYQIGYKVGYNEGLTKQSDPHFVPLQKCPVRLEDCKAYKLGLEDGYKFYKHLEQWFAETCFYDDEDNLFPEYKRRQADTCCLEDIITDVGFAEMLKRVKAYEEKKKAEEEIKVGDILHEIDTNNNHIIVGIYDGHYETIVFNGTDFDSAQINRDYTLKTDYEKLDKNVFNEVSQLFDKLRGEEE